LGFKLTFCNFKKLIKFSLAKRRSIYEYKEYILPNISVKAVLKAESKIQIFESGTPESISSQEIDRENERLNSIEDCSKIKVLKSKQTFDKGKTCLTQMRLHMANSKEEYPWKKLVASAKCEFSKAKRELQMSVEDSFHKTSEPTCFICVSKFWFYSDLIHHLQSVERISPMQKNDAEKR